MSLIALSFRILSAPELCVHDNISLNIMYPAEISVECHNRSHEKKADVKTGHLPCDHMKQCLLDSGDRETAFQKTVKTPGIYGQLICAIHKPSLTQDLYPASSYARDFNRPPPEVQYLHTPVYIAKSSFLI